jgi:hypothetical protein
MVALVFVVAALAAVSLGLLMLYRWASKFDTAEQDEIVSGTPDREDPDGFSRLGLVGAASSGSSSRN